MLATVTTGAGGVWSLVTQPGRETSYRAGWDGIESAAVVVGVRPRVEIERLESGLIAASIAPSSACGRCELELERTRAGGWRRAAQLEITSALGRLVLPEPVSTGSALVRLSVRVDERTSGFLSATSSPLSYRAAFASIATVRIPAGGAALLAGRSTPAVAGQPVTVLIRTHGAASASSALTLLSRADGRWRLRVAPPKSTAYLIVDGAGIRHLFTVEVGGALAVTALANGAIAVRADATRNASGELVELQREQGLNAWTSVLILPLPLDGRAVFPPLRSAGGSLRVALVGAGSGSTRPLAVSDTFPAPSG
jgi:hypothetical protein